MTRTKTATAAGDGIVVTEHREKKTGETDATTETVIVVRDHNQRWLRVFGFARGRFFWKS